jgi:hypothetical protein
MDELETIEQVRHRIAKIVEENWKLSQRATLLSTLGFTLKKELPESSSVLSDGLRGFITQWPSVQIVSHPTIKEKIGAVPLGTSIPEDASPLFQPPAVRRQNKYLQDFWRAFYLPMNQRRFVILPSTDDAPARVIDSAEPPDEHPNYEITPSDLVVVAPDAPIAEKARKVGNNLRAWIKRNSVPENKLIERPAPAHRNVREPTAGEFSADLANAFAQLDAADQARIFIPLDLVQKMLSGKS